MTGKAFNHLLKTYLQNNTYHAWYKIPHSVIIRIMTIERIEMQRGRVKKVTSVIPGFSERLSPRGWNLFRADFGSVNGVGWEEVHVEVKTDDDLVIKYQMIDTPGTLSGKPLRILRREQLSKHAINDHDVVSDKSFWGNSVAYKWRPSVWTVSPQEELAIQELLTKSVLTEEDAQNMRDRIMFEAQQKAGLIPGNLKRLK